jgi:hypothetical protein
MTASMDDPRLKIGWAQGHIDTLESEVREFFDGRSYEVLAEFDAKTIWHVARLRINKRTPDDRWSLMVGDAIQNLRSALDHAVYQLAIAWSKCDPPPDERSIEFPVFKDEKGQAGFVARGKPKLAGINPRAAARIEGIQPYNASNYEDDPLWLVHELNIIDKHRRIHVTAAMAKTATLRRADGIASAIAGGSGIVPVGSDPASPPLVDGAVLQRARLAEYREDTGPDRDVYAKLDIRADAAFDLAFGKETPLVALKFVTPTLRSVAQNIEDVISSLEEFL